MLKSIDPLLGPDLLHALAAMGHGDEIALVDANFPAESVAQATVLGQPLRLPGIDAPRAARAILSLLPLDSFVDEPVRRMEVVGEPATVPAVQGEVRAVVDGIEGRRVAVGSLDRFAFYEAARGAYCVLATGEPRFYGCFLFRKGVIAPGG